MSSGEKVGRGDLVDMLAQKAGLTKAKADEVIGLLVYHVQTSVKKGKSVTIVGFGTFEPRKRAARKGRNPATGEALKIKASTVPGFRAGSKFKSVVSGKK